jgi:hypothetical protein
VHLEVTRGTKFIHYRNSPAVKRSNMELCKGCPAQNFSNLTGNGTMRPHCTCRAHLAAIVQRVWVGCATFVPLRLGACMRLQSIKPPPSLRATQRKSAISFFFLHLVSTLPRAGEPRASRHSHRLPTTPAWSRRRGPSPSPHSASSRSRRRPQGSTSPASRPMTSRRYA